MERQGTDRNAGNAKASAIAVDPSPMEEQAGGEVPEDVAILYSWANLQGGKYRDFSASRREYRAQMRRRAAEALREQELEAAVEAEVTAQAAESQAEVAEVASQSFNNAAGDAQSEYSRQPAGLPRRDLRPVAGPRPLRSPNPHRCARTVRSPTPKPPASVRLRDTQSPRSGLSSPSQAMGFPRA
jgi:hypothetical protein